MIGLWGTVVADGFFWVFAAVGVVGAANLIQGILEERKLRLTAREAESDRKILRELQDWTKKNPGKTEPPLRLRNYATLTNSELQQVMLEAAEKVRRFADEHDRGRQTESVWDVHPDFLELPQREQEAAWKRHNKQTTEAYNAIRREYRRLLHPDLVPIYEELDRRLGTESSYTVSRNFVTGHMAGAMPYHQAADEIEFWARKLDEAK